MTIKRKQTIAIYILSATIALSVLAVIFSILALESWLSSYRDASNSTKQTIIALNAFENTASNYHLAVIQTMMGSGKEVDRAGLEQAIQELVKIKVELEGRHALSNETTARLPELIDRFEEGLAAIAKADSYGASEIYINKIHLKASALSQALKRLVSQNELKLNGRFDRLASREIPLVFALFIALLSLLATISIITLISFIRDMRPLINAVDFAKTIQNGNYTIRAKVERDDEIGQLTRAMNDMADALAKNQEENQRHIARLGCVMKDIQAVSSKMLSYSNSLRKSNEILSNGSQQVFTSLKKSETSLLSLERDSRMYVANVLKVNEQSKSISELAASGDQSMQSMVTSIVDINNEADEMAKIIQIIDSISFKTNILALNASVEAAHAGIAGKSFAVVAEEVRTLATKSARAAQETAELIAHSSAKINQGRDLVLTAASIFEKINSGVFNIGQSVEEIANASQDQMNSMQVLMNEIRQIDDIIAHNKGVASETEITAQALNLEAVRMNEILQEHQEYLTS